MENRPNIIVYMSDQQRHDSVGCYGQKLPTTPVLDALANEGILFENAFSCQPVCGPARSCIQTGLYPNLTGCYVNEIGLKDDENTIAKELSKGGYETAYVGKWHLASDFPKGLVMVKQPIPLNRLGGYKDYIMVSEALELTSHGYDGYVFDKNGKRHDFIGYRADCITDYAINYLHNRMNDKPFFLFISQIEPHQQNDHNCFEGPDGSKEKFSNYDKPQDLIGGKYEGDWESNYADYLGCCNSLDNNLGKLISTLKELDVYDNTVILYFSDHGCHFKTQEGEYKRNCFESSIHVPLVIRGGPFIGGKRIKDLVSIVNIPSTILEIAKIPIPSKMVYEPLQNILNEETKWNNVFFQISETELARGIRTEKWKYCVHAPHKQPLFHMDDNFTTEGYHEMLSKCKMSSDSYYEQYLFDLENDPYEKCNLVTSIEYSEVRKVLSGILKESMVKAGESEPEIFSAITKK